MERALPPSLGLQRDRDNLLPSLEALALFRTVECFLDSYCGAANVSIRTKPPTRRLPSRRRLGTDRMQVIMRLPIVTPNKHIRYNTNRQLYIDEKCLETIPSDP